jgi:hypothetical protein
MGWLLSLKTWKSFKLVVRLEVVWPFSIDGVCPFLSCSFLFDVIFLLLTREIWAFFLSITNSLIPFVLSAFEQASHVA